MGRDASTAELLVARLNAAVQRAQAAEARAERLAIWNEGLNKDLRFAVEAKDRAEARAGRLEAALGATVGILVAQDEFGELMEEEYAVLDAARAALAKGDKP